MTPIGWLLMLLSWLTIISLFVFCLTKVLTTNHRKSDRE